MALRTRLGEILRPLNAEYGKVAPGWGTTPIMGYRYGSIFSIFVNYLTNIQLIFNYRKC